MSQRSLCGEWFLFLNGFTIRPRMEYKKRLTEWGLGDFIPLFEDEGIDDDSFSLLDDSTIDVIFKKIGPRLKFKKEYTSLLQSVSKEKIIETDEDNSLMFELDEELKQIFDDDVSESRSESRSESSVDIPACSTPKKLKTVLTTQVLSDKLENILQGTPEGRLILLHKKKLNNDMRQKLCKVVVSELIKLHNEPFKAELKAFHFACAAEEIVKLFPGEIKDTYFIPYSSAKFSGLRQPAKGKLWSRYVNIKAALRVANRNTIHNKAIEVSHVEDDNVEADLIFLKSAIEPYVRIAKAWENTFPFRQKHYKNVELDQIFSDFPCLSTSYTLELVEHDFNQLFDDKIDIIYNEWPKVSEAILEEINDRKIILPNLNLDVSSKSLLALPYLFSPVTVKNHVKNSSNWRPTRVEIRESFVFAVKDFQEFQEILHRRKAKLDKFNLPLQPFAVWNEALENEAEAHFFIYFHERHYKCTSAIRCLELLFKIFHGLNLEYPVESRHVWNFIQELVFKIPNKSKNSASSSVVADVSSHM